MTEDVARSHYMTEEVDPLFIVAARARLLPFFRHGRVVNVGLGYGTWDAWLATQPDEVTGLDLDDALVKHFAAKYPSIRYVTADATTWEPPARFDTIVASHFLEHVDAPSETLRFWKRTWLKDGGRILLVVPNADSLHRHVGQRMGFLQERTDLNEADLKIGHKRVYDRKLFEQHLRDAGVEIVHLESATMKPLSNGQLAAMPRAYLDACLALGGAELGDTGNQLLAVVE